MPCKGMKNEAFLRRLSLFGIPYLIERASRFMEEEELKKFEEAVYCKHDEFFGEPDQCLVRNENTHP